MKARLTLTVEFELDRKNYRYNPITDSNLTDEEVKALTGTQMLNLERYYLKDGDTTLEEIVDSADIDLEDEEQVKWELVEGDAPE